MDGATLLEKRDFATARVTCGHCRVSCHLISLPHLHRVSGQALVLVGHEFHLRQAEYELALR
jgi:hypothetical protein